MSTLKFKPYNQAITLNVDQLCLCKCDNWNEEGFQIAVWDGEEFIYDNQPNPYFNRHVTYFMPISENEIIFEH